MSDPRDRSPRPSMSDDQRERGEVHRKDNAKSASPVFHKRVKKQEKVVLPELSEKEKRERIDGHLWYKVPMGSYPFFAMMNRITGDNCIRFMQGRCRIDCYCNTCRETTEERTRRMALSLRESGEGSGVQVGKPRKEVPRSRTQRTGTNYIPIGPRSTLKSPESIEDLHPLPLEVSGDIPVVTMSSDDDEVQEVRTVTQITLPEEPADQDDEEYHAPDPVDTMREVFALVRVTETEDGEVSNVCRVPTDPWFQHTAAKAVDYQLLKDKEITESLGNSSVASKEASTFLNSTKSFAEFCGEP